ncbi:thiol:disulfide interchange protein DsbA/DsbL [Marinicellulosiphila megalodicopiae]|uniref:thiol:disulfide interchange protein DsbA/DsbL n=1 Tax=Marinicellulosiphila megalodicopiae TaxID=2724896 RepID=UPI003BAF77CD
MNIYIKTVFFAIVTFMTISSCSDKSNDVAADSPLLFVEGTHWSVLNEPLEYKLKKGEIGVIWEVFSYSCSHCNAFEPFIKQWRKSAPEEIAFEPVPVMWNAKFNTQATAFYTAQLLNVPEQAHGKLFDAIHITRAKIGSLEDFAQFYSNFGISEDRFISTSKSFAVKSMVDNAQKISTQVDATPTLIVNGKYLITTKMVPNRQTILEVAQYLVERDAANK